MKPVFALLVGSGALCLAAEAPDCGLVPGWQQHGPARHYVADNLFDYMNGNAEGYLIYGFLQMNGVTCKSGEATLIIDISQMAGAEMAYGIFAANRDPRIPTQKIGMGGQIQPRRAIFAKDKYFVEIAATPEMDHSAALAAFVAALERRIEGRTALPEMIAWFPPEKLVAESVRLIPQSVLGLRLLKRGYVAEYPHGKAFIVAEASAEEAATVMEKLQARFVQTEPARVADEAFQFNDKYLGRLCFFRKGRYLAGYANAAQGQDVVVLATTLSNRIP